MDHEPTRFGRAGRPGSRLCARPPAPTDVLDALFDDLPATPAPPFAGSRPAFRPPKANDDPAGDRVDPGVPPGIGPGAPERPLDDAPEPPPAPIRMWWDDPRDRRALPDRPRAHPEDDWPRPVIPPGAPPPPYDGCRWPRACAVLARRVSCPSLLPCRCHGGVLLARPTADDAIVNR